MALRCWAEGLSRQLAIGISSAFIACVPSESPPTGSTHADRAEPQFVGRQACSRCHANENRQWEGSHHDLAMQEANEDTILGDFDNASFTYNGVTSKFFLRDGKHFVRTDGPNGELRDYPIAYTFGAMPLQQYLIEFPGGRYQALSIGWDARTAAQGGQRWFHLYPDDAIDHADPLHWTGIHQNWNYMCAECHSTNLEKGFDLEEDRFETTWSEIDVSCEACHGPGSQHVAWADSVGAEEKRRHENGHLGLAVRLEDPGRGTWMVSPETGSGLRLAPPVETWEIETCARCHSRRSLVSEAYEFARPIMDSYRPALLEEDLYHADGQILEEVYVYGSYLQSRMYLKGVTCSDCHDPHSLELHFPGDAVCFRCHSQAEFATDKHHFHDPGTRGAFCVDCHMPPKNYMLVDPRHDHSLRVPRPDLSLRLGTPNACNGCHGDKSAKWSIDWVTRWYGPDRRAEKHFAEAIHAGRSASATAERELLAVARNRENAPIARATALALLAGVATAGSVATVEQSLAADDPLVRMGALRALEGLPTRERVSLAAPLLTDPVRTVRVEAVRVLVVAPGEALSREQRSRLMAAAQEYRAAQWSIAERPEAHLNLGWLEVNLGSLEAAEASYRRALERDPGFVPAIVNLSDLYRQQGRDAEGERLLREALGDFPDSAELHHGLGLLLARRGRSQEALEAFERASELAPDIARFAFVYAVALHDLGDTVSALEILEDTHERFPANREVLMGLISFHRQAGSLREARRLSERLLALEPTNAELQQLTAELEAEASS